MKRVFSFFIFLLCGVFIFALFYENSNGLFSKIFEYSTVREKDDDIEKHKLCDNDEMRACWFSYLEWQLFFKNKNQNEFQDKAKEVFDGLKNNGINTVFVHVRAFGDAMYKSEISPVSKYFAASMCENLPYDPIDILIDLAHEYNISIHAWINPLRTMNDDDFEKVPDKYIIKKWYLSENRSDYYMKDLTGKYILIPANPEVREYIVRVVEEIMTKYKFEGIHIDDYFYPSGVDSLSENDVSYYNKVKADCDIGVWRRNSTSDLIKSMHSKCHEIDFKSQFGVSPQANLKNNYESMFIDVKQWLSEDGYVDYIMPQIYFGFDNSSHPFDATMKEWNDLIKNDVKLYVGMALYKAGIENDVHAGLGSKEWKNHSDILKRQEQCARKYDKYRGYCLYSYQCIYRPDSNSNSACKQEIENLNSCF